MHNSKLFSLNASDCGVDADQFQCDSRCEDLGILRSSSKQQIDLEIGSNDGTRREMTVVSPLTENIPVSNHTDIV